MLTLKTLKFKGIGRFVEEQTVSFDKFGSLVQVDGKNNNTGGSSGAGKSTIFNALDFLFGLNSVPNSILQSRLTEESMFVEAEFDFDGQGLVISRGKKLKITLNGEVTTGSAKLSEEKLDQILAVPRHLFRPMLHKKQGEKGFFLNFTPKETNDFLTDCLGLGAFKKHLLALDSKIADLSKLSIVTSSELESTNATLKSCQLQLEHWGKPPEEEVDEQTIPFLKANMEASNAVLSQTYARHVEEQKALDSKKPVYLSQSVDQSAKLALDAALSDLKKRMQDLLLRHKDLNSQAEMNVMNIKSKISDLEFKINRGKDAKLSATKIAAEIKKIRDSICPKCEQTWATEAAKREEKSLIETINKLREFVVEGERSVLELDQTKEQLQTAYASFPPAVPEEYPAMLVQERSIKDQIVAASNLISARNAEIDAENKKIQTEFFSLQSALNQRHSAEINSARTEAETNRRKYDTAVLQVKAYKERLAIFVQALRGIKEQELSFSHRAMLLTEQLKMTNVRIQQAEELKKAVKSYLSCSFDEALESIGNNATQMIRNIPNMANATIQLEGLRETKEGKVKEEVTAVIHMDGDTNVDIRSLCGGERTSTDLAIDLSVVDFIESKTNKGINVFILDEPFTGLDTQCIEMALDMLQKSNFNKKLIVVDHNPIVKEHISDRITVTRTGETSYIQR